MAKPDNREDNVPRLQNQITNTIQNMEEAEEYLAEHAEELSAVERQRIEAKNERRRQSLDGLRSEIRDEAEYRSKQQD